MIRLRLVLLEGDLKKRKSGIVRGALERQSGSRNIRALVHLFPKEISMELNILSLRPNLSNVFGVSLVVVFTKRVDIKPLSHYLRRIRREREGFWLDGKRDLAVSVSES